MESSVDNFRLKLLAYQKPGPFVKESKSSRSSNSREIYHFPPLVAFLVQAILTKWQIYSQLFITNYSIIFQGPMQKRVGGGGQFYISDAFLIQNR